jgi:hypothetical protein
MPQPYPNGELVIVVDCSDLERSARFWCGVLGYTASPPSGLYRTLTPESGVGIEVLLQRVPDVKGQAPQPLGITAPRHVGASAPGDSPRETGQDLTYERATEPHHRLVP